MLVHVLASTLLGCCVLRGAEAFPVSSISLSADELRVLNSSGSPLRMRETVATSAVLPHLQLFFNNTAHAIEVEAGTIEFRASLPDQKVDSSCDHTVTAEHPKAVGTVLNTSRLMFGASSLAWRNVTVFADARLNARLAIAADVRVELGKHVFGHHCTHLGHKTVGVSVASTGHNALGLTFTAANATLVRNTTTKGLELVFDFHADVVGVVLDWNVQQVKASGCKIKILVRASGGGGVPARCPSMRSARCPPRHLVR